MDRSTACAKVQRTTEFTDPRIRRGDRGVQEREGEVCQKKKSLPKVFLHLKNLLREGLDLGFLKNNLDIL